MYRDSNLANDYAVRNLPWCGSNWANAGNIAYFKMEKIVGDVFLPFVKIPTNDGFWIMGSHGATNKLQFRYYKDSNTASSTWYEFEPNISKTL